ncbi:MAG: hypothetical protein E3J52_09530 [Promethearchaeota archaeon]|nr:MAG: hypothetical protein E3J52_09530 [Candidatus Lokiarchaeota archaeon]
MSYIEKKYRLKINEIFEDLPILENYLIELLNRNSVKVINEIASVCAKFNKSINLILKKYYPEIKEMKDKLEIKSFLKFYYELIAKLTDLIRNIENFQKIDPEYYDKLIEFIDNKETLINGKYKAICAKELTAFYDPTSRANLEKIISEKFLMESKQYFTFGSLEEEIKKIAKIAGANQVSILPVEELYRKELESAESIISYTVLDDKDKKILLKIGTELKQYLESKNYNAVVKPSFIITNAKLFSD